MAIKPELRILVVDDEEIKRNLIGRLVKGEFESADLAFEYADSIVEARQKLRQNQYDLMILDIALPERAGAPVNVKGGVNLLKEITSRNVYMRPSYVVGLTGRQDVYDDAASEFGSELWSVVFYDAASETWVQPISRRIRYMLQPRGMVNQAQPDTYVCIVVAVVTELEQIKANGWAWERLEIPGDASVYYQSSFVDKGGEHRRAILAQTSLMGMSAAAIMATKMGLTFKPRLVVMPGICAGDSDQVGLGDLIGANPAWDYGSAKHKGVEISGEFEPAPYQLGMSTRIRGLVERLKEDENFFRGVRDTFRGSKPSDPSKLHVGPFASGAAVVANKAVFRDIQAVQHRKLLGLDMEAYGTFAAVSELPQPQPECLVLKGVSDFADVQKGDKMREYAAFLSGAAMTRLLEEYGL